MEITVAVVVLAVAVFFAVRSIRAHKAARKNTGGNGGNAGPMSKPDKK